MNKRKLITPFVRQVWSVSAVQLTLFGVGMTLSYPSSLLPGLREPDSTIRVDMHTASWLVSSVAISSIPGYFLTSFLMHRYGRRTAFGLSLTPGILGWIVIYFASNVQTLMTGIILSGISIGASNFVGATAIGEYMCPEYRGMFLNLKTAFFSMGCLLVHTLAHYLFWRTIALIALIPAILSFIITWTWPESPAWLASKKKFEKCESAFLSIRGNNEQATKELNELIKAQMDLMKGSDTKPSFLDTAAEFFKKFKRMDFLKPMFIIYLTNSLMELSGRHIFPAYALDIIGEITGNKTQSLYYVLGLDIILTVSSLFSSVLAKFTTRRGLLFGTGWTAVAMLVIFCAYQFSMPVEHGNYSWISISILVLYFIFASQGCTPIPLGIFGEIVPLAYRAFGSAVAGIIFAFNLYSTLQITPYLLASIKVRGTFAVLGAGMAVCLLVLYFILPETKDRTLQEIDNYFTYGQYTVDRSSDEGKEEESKMLEKNELIELIGV